MTADLVGSERGRRHPTAALDPPRSAASPAVPALLGSESPSALFGRDLRTADALDLGNRLELGQVFLSPLSQPTDAPGIREELRDVSLGDRQGIGRASWRDRVCQAVSISVVAV